MSDLSSIKWVLLVGWLAAAIAISASLFGSEPTLADPNMIALLRDAIEQNAVLIKQQSADQPLAVEFGDSVPALGPTIAQRRKVTKDQWERLVRTVNQYVATANWGLGDPFTYADDNAGGQAVTGFRPDEFEYTNPFTTPAPEIAKTPIRSSTELTIARKGWRVIGNGVTLFLSTSAPQDEVEVGFDGSTKEGTNLVARKFKLIAPDGAGIHFSIGSSAIAGDKSTRLQVETFNSSDSTSQWSRKYQSGQYFLWHGKAFAVYEVSNRPSQPIPPNTAAKIGESTNDILVITKTINGRPTRIQLLGQATTNLIGARVGGYLPYLDGSLRHDQVNQVTLTIDPELQYGAFYYLRNVLGKFDGHYGIGRSRTGSVTILDAENGQIRAFAGFPSYEADWAERRRILINRDELLRRNPASEVHMPGSAIKVLSVSLGYLLFGDARSNLLPASEDDPAVRQAFQDTYGVALTEPLNPPLGKPTKAAEDRFAGVGGKTKVLSRSVQALREVYVVSPTKEATDSTMPLTEAIISPNLQAFFDEKKLSEGLYPVTSKWPIKDATSMNELWLYALGAGAARFTTLRLAAILATASSGKVIKPYIVESITNRSDTVLRANSDSVRDIELLWNGIESNVTKMTTDMPKALKNVLLPPVGTGHFLRDEGKPQYLAVDDPTSVVNEEARRKGIDFGKSGTADYGDPPPGENRKFPDSIFVYRHGRYVIAVWLEQTDKGGKYEKDIEGWNQNPAHKLVHRIVQLIESLESQ
jgi:hypothetical protein